MDGNHFAAQRGKHLALILHAVNGITHQRTCIVEVEQTLIACIVGMAGHGNPQVAEGLKGHTAVLTGTQRHYLLVGQQLGFLVFPFENQLPDLWKVFFGCRVTHLVGLSGPDSFFVQLNPFHGWCAKHHTAHGAVTDGQCLCPGHGWTVVPQLVRVFRNDRQAAEPCHQDDDMSSHFLLGVNLRVFSSSRVTFVSSN